MNLLTVPGKVEKLEYFVKVEIYTFFTTCLEKRQGSSRDLFVG